jgi:hypothetical protein
LKAKGGKQQKPLATALEEVMASIELPTKS